LAAVEAAEHDRPPTTLPGTGTPTSHGRNLLEQSRRLSADRDEYFARDVQAAMADVADEDVADAYDEARTSWRKAKAEEFKLRAAIAAARADAAAAGQRAQDRLDAIWAPAEVQYHWMDDLGTVEDLARLAGDQAEEFRVAARDAHDASDRADTLRAAAASAAATGDNGRYDQPVEEAGTAEVDTAGRRESELYEALYAAGLVQRVYSTRNPSREAAPSLDENGLPTGWARATFSPPGTPTWSAGKRDMRPAEPVKGFAGYPPPMTRSR